MKWLVIFCYLLTACSMSRFAQHNPQAAYDNVRLGLAYLKRGDQNRAKAKLLLAKRQDPQSEVVFGALGYFYESAGQTKLAEQYYRQALAVGDNPGAAENNYAIFLCRQGRYAQGIRYFKRAISRPDYLGARQAIENAKQCQVSHSA